MSLQVDKKANALGCKRGHVRPGLDQVQRLVRAQKEGLVASYAQKFCQAKLVGRSLHRATHSLGAANAPNDYDISTLHKAPNRDKQQRFRNAKHAIVGKGGSYVGVVF